MAALMGVVPRAAAVGMVTVFPEGIDRAWNDNRDAPRLARRQGVDDVAFLQALVAGLVAEGIADPSRVFFCGISNGGFMSEMLARQARVPVAGIALVAAGATEPSRRWGPPARPCTVLLFEGTGDPIVPYGGGPISILGGLRNSRNAAPSARPAAGRRGEQGGRGIGAPVEAVAQDWAVTNGCGPTPAVEALPCPPGGLPVTRLTWSAPGRPWVSLHRVEGGGHTWPGGPQYLPPRIVGPVATNLDATGIILQSFAAAPRP
jgi:polyhydroxybutyrate depolymerase